MLSYFYNSRSSTFLTVVILSQYHTQKCVKGVLNNTVDDHKTSDIYSLLVSALCLDILNENIRVFVPHPPILQQLIYWTIVVHNKAVL